MHSRITEMDGIWTFSLSNSTKPIEIFMDALWPTKNINNLLLKTMACYMEISFDRSADNYYEINLYLNIIVSW